jgi:hypothetical protein
MRLPARRDFGVLSIHLLSTAISSSFWPSFRCTMVPARCIRVPAPAVPVAFGGLDGFVAEDQGFVEPALALQLLDWLHELQVVNPFHHAAPELPPSCSASRTIADS